MHWCAGDHQQGLTKMISATKQSMMTYQSVPQSHLHHLIDLRNDLINPQASSPRGREKE